MANEVQRLRASLVRMRPGYCGPAATPTTLSVTSYSQTWGAWLIITPSLGWLHGH